MHIERKMIHPELRRSGLAFRAVVPHYTEKTFRLFNFFMDHAMKGKCKSKISYQEKWLPRPDGSRLRICVYSPPEQKKNVPGLLWIHGGGYAMGIPEQDELYIRRFVEASGCVVVAPDYARSVDKPYPAALKDCYASLRWLKKYGGAYGMRSDQIFIGGTSAGGGLTAAVSLYARDKKEIAIAFQMPLYPMIDDRMKMKSAVDNDAPIWDSKSNDAGWRLYLGVLFGTDRVPAYAAPARAEDYRNLPPTFTFAGSIEPFRDETIAYVKALKKQGVTVHFKEYKGCFHGFDTIAGNTEIARKATAFLMETFQYAVNHYFAKQPTPAKEE